MISVKVTGLNNLEKKFSNSPDILDKEMYKAMGKSLLMVESESKRRTPVDTGLLRSSIGGARGTKRIAPFRAEIGTNVKYAVYVHEGHARHTVGERKFMEKGGKVSIPYIKSEINKAVKRLANYLGD